jgi:single-strand DNA-binding protein
MNKVILLGRLTRDPEIRYSAGAESKAVAKFSLAVNRAYKKEGEQSADFINIVAFGKNAEFAEKYFRKGQQILIEGRWQTGSYEKNGTKYYTNDCIVERFDFADSKKEAGAPEPEPQPDADGFMSIPDGIDEDVPFN